MRLTGGRLAGRRLKTVEGEGFRPATAMLREALFSMLDARGLDYEGLAVLDLYAGSGSLALEALSRGAARAVCVELNKKAADIIAGNAVGLEYSHQLRVVSQDVFAYLRKEREAFGLVFIDPPYGKKLMQRTLKVALAEGFVAPGALVAAEVEDRAEVDPEAFPELTLETDRRYGQTRLLLWKRA